MIDWRVPWLRLVFPIITAGVFLVVIALPFGGIGPRVALWYRRWVESL